MINIQFKQACDNGDFEKIESLFLSWPADQRIVMTNELQYALNSDNLQVGEYILSLYDKVDHSEWPDLLLKLKKAEISFTEHPDVYKILVQEYDKIKSKLDPNNNEDDIVLFQTLVELKKGINRLEMANIPSQGNEAIHNLLINCTDNPNKLAYFYTVLTNAGITYPENKKLYEELSMSSFKALLIAPKTLILKRQDGFESVNTTLSIMVFFDRMNMAINKEDALYQLFEKNWPSFNLNIKIVNFLYDNDILYPDNKEFYLKILEMRISFKALEKAVSRLLTKGISFKENSELYLIAIKELDLKDNFEPVDWLTELYDPLKNPKPPMVFLYAPPPPKQALTMDICPLCFEKGSEQIDGNPPRLTFVEFIRT